MAFGDFGGIFLVRRSGDDVDNRDVLFVRIQGDVASVDVGTGDARVLDGLPWQVDTSFGCYDGCGMDEDAVRDGS